MTFKPYPKPDKQPKKAKKGLSKKKAYDADLWGVFSVYVRLRYADVTGVIRCITCGVYRFWKGQHMQAGHGIPRQHWGTRYNEINVQVQCSGCNKFQQGASDKFKQYVNKKYGPFTWETLEASKNGKKYTEFEMRVLQVDLQKKIELHAKRIGLSPDEYQTKGWIK